MRPSIRWQLGFLRGFLGGESARVSPYALSVDVTRRCNLSCLHCRRHSPHAAVAKNDAILDDFPPDRFLSLCREAKEMGIRKMVLIGEGEPLLHPHLLEMVTAAHDAGCAVTLLTNGTLLTADHAARFREAGLDELRISLWASDEEEYRLQYPGTPPAMFHQTVRAVRALAEERRAQGGRHPRLVLHRPVEARFFRRLEGTLDLARETGCDAVSFSAVKPLLPGDAAKMLSGDDERELLRLLPDLGLQAARRGLAHNTVELRKRLEIGRAVWEKFPCYIGWVDMRIRVNGDAVPCDTCSWVLGNVHHARLSAIWNGPAYRAFRATARQPGGLQRSDHDCRCDFCCHAVTNTRLYRILRWISPPPPHTREIAS